MRSSTQGVVLVTGASSGIGRACVLRLVRSGHLVYGTTRQSPAEVQAQLRDECGGTDRLVILGVDVTRTETVDRAIAAIVEQTGRLDAVVNCAGFGIAGAIEDTSDEEAWSQLETNLLGTHRVCRAALRVMRPQRSGALINISSIAGRIGLPFQGFYSASKFAIEGYTEALRLEVRPLGIRVSLVEPGDFSTGFTDSRHLCAAAEGSPYEAACQRTMSIVETDERTAPPPDAVAVLVERILRARSPRLRHTVGPFVQRLAVVLKRALPNAWLEAALRMTYKVDRRS
jgi:NAD(P)-dependent dehydrogenase (short-subunit alcohol dehydrogenase family)